MSTEAIILLVARFGIPMAEQIYNLVKTWGDKEVTQADWAALREINARPLSYYEQPLPITGEKPG